jgi:hypothetical protein
MVALRVAELRN